MITGEPVETAKFAAAAEGTLIAAGFAVRYVALQAKEWKALSINERRVKLTLGEVGTFVSYQTGTPLANAAQSIFAGVIFFGIVGLLSGYGFRWDVGTLYGAAGSLYTAVRSRLLLRSLEQIRARRL